MKVACILRSFALLLFLAIQTNAFAGRCTGSAYCHACTTCNYCKHCAQNGGTCGVCAGGDKEERYSASGTSPSHRGGSILPWLIAAGLGGYLLFGRKDTTKRSK